MSLIDQIRRDIQQITSNQNEFGVSVTLTAPDQTVLQTTGTTKKHHIRFSEEGVAVNSKNASVSISEYNLIQAGYPYRDINQEVDMLSHLVTVKDSSEIDKHYKIVETFPDETIGLIVCLLEDYIQ